MGTHHITIKQGNLTTMFQEKHRQHLGRRGFPSPTETREPDAHPLPMTWRIRLRQDLRDLWSGKPWRQRPPLIQVLFTHLRA